MSMNRLSAQKKKKRRKRIAVTTGSIRTTVSGSGSLANEKNEELTGLVEVTCGASDGDMVEILSGLQPGDTVNYEYTETLSEIIF